MSCKMARFIYDSDTPLAVAAGSPIMFAKTTSTTSAIQYNGAGGVLIKAPGTYRVVSSFTLSATAAGAVNVSMSANGNPATGARAGATLATAGDLDTLSIVDLITVKTGVSGSYATLTFAPDAAVGIRTANVLVEKVG